MGEQFAVLLFFDDGKRRYARRFVSAQEACRVFEHCIHSAGARLGRTVCVVITDRNDCILREWKCSGRSLSRPGKNAAGLVAAGQVNAERSG